ncbi:MAG: hypothetical protein ABH833_03745 [Parcubacteria group bacterium]
MSNLWQTIVIGFISGGIGVTIIGTLLNNHFTKKLENDSLQKIQAAKIATFLAKWAKYNAKEKEILNERELYDYYEELTKMSYELSLWIKDEQLLIKIMDRLMLKGSAPQPKELLIEIRELILGKKSKELAAKHLASWELKDDE